jgi:phenylacetic acid degradation operon negative regulatory protein
VRPTAKRIILELLSATETHEASSSGLVDAAKLLGVAENSVRVTLTRLVAAGTLELTGRGQYRLGKATRAITRQVTGWRELEKQVRPWDGAWVCVASFAAKSDRAAARRRDRAFGLLGFRMLDRVLAVRPDNLAGGVAALRDQLHALGVEEAALIFRATDFDRATDQRARRLWAGERLTARYVQMRERIEKWLVTLDDLPLESAAREAFFFGGDVLRTIMFDPRLPEPLVDVAARRALVDSARRLDTSGRRLWARLYGMPHGLVITPEHHREHARN